MLATQPNLFDIDAGTLVLALKDQRPATIAFVLRQLPAERAPQIVGKLDRPTRQAVARCLAAPGGVGVDAAGEVIRGLQTELHRLASGGMVRARNVLEACDQSVQSSLLRSLAAADAGLARSLHCASFRFQDLCSLSSSAMLSLIRNIDFRTWAMALVGQAEVRQKLERYLSGRAIQLLRDEIDYLGTVSASEADQARSQIMDVARSLV